jgi:hypothetical protein
MISLLLLTSFVLEQFHSNDGAASVLEVLPGTETRIIHIRDWHLVPKEAFAADTELTGDALYEAYGQHVKVVKAVQASQKKLLSGVKEVHVEGLCPRDMPAFEAMIRFQRKRPDEDSLLHMGAAAQLMVEGTLKVLPAEADGFERANPVKDGRIGIDEKAQEAREDEIVRSLLKKKGTVYLMLGGAHDLSDNIERLSEDCGNVVVTPKGWPE